MTDNDGGNGKGPLAGIRVLDLTEFLAGPYGTQILGDLGAEIIKVETFEGDSSRHVAPHFIAGSSTYFTSIGRNKKAIVLDLRKPEGLAVAHDLARCCDIFFENRRPGVMDRLGVGYEALKEINPSIIYCSISGFGQNGPDRERAAYDIVVQAASGGMSLTGEKGGRPVRAGLPIGDVCAGMYGVIGILAALHRRTETGQGEYIDISMLDVQVAMMCYQAAVYLNTGNVPGPQGRTHDFLPLINTFEAGDGLEVVVAGNSQKMFKDLCEVLGTPELLEDERFATSPLRNVNRAALEPVIAEAFKKFDADDVAARLRATGYPCSVVNTVDRALTQPQTVHRNMVLELEGDEPDQRARVAGNPLKLRESAKDGNTYPPPLGADTREVLADVLGYDAAKIESLLAKGAVGDTGTVKQAAE